MHLMSSSPLYFEFASLPVELKCHDCLRPRSTWCLLCKSCSVRRLTRVEPCNKPDGPASRQQRRSQIMESQLTIDRGDFFEGHRGN